MNWFHRNVAASVQAQAKLIADAAAAYQTTHNERICEDLVASIEVILERLTEDFHTLIKRRKESAK